MSRKAGWVHNSFNTMNFSFILKGEGEYRRDGRRWSVTAPAVITQWPGMYLEYGPDREWEELYIVYDPSLVDELRQRRYAVEQHPVWLIHESGPTRRKLAELRELLSDVNTHGRADEIDRICDLMILESLIGESRATIGDEEQGINTIRDYIHENYLKSIDFDDVALEHGFSPASFRRFWRRFIGIPPARYMMRIRFRQACRLLVETDLSVGDIAKAVSFEDPLYFSRVFRKVVGQTATAYRSSHLTPLSLGEAD